MSVSEAPNSIPTSSFSLSKIPPLPTPSPADNYTGGPRITPVMKHAIYLGLALAAIFLAGCATPSRPGAAARVAGMAKVVRMTAYTSGEPGGCHDACGGILSTGAIHSAAADWSRYPVGTRFQIVETGEVCEIDDYGSALIGTNTIDLYKDNRREMRNWGVRMVHIKFLVWGSPRRSLEILTPRARNHQVRPMIAALRQQTQGTPAKFHRIQS